MPYFTSIPPFGSHATRLLKAFLSMLCNSIGIQCVHQLDLDIIGRSLVLTLGDDIFVYYDVSIYDLNLLDRLLVLWRNSIILDQVFL